MAARRRCCHLSTAVSGRYVRTKASAIFALYICWWSVCCSGTASGQTTDFGISEKVITSANATDNPISTAAQNMSLTPDALTTMPSDRTSDGAGNDRDPRTAVSPAPNITAANGYGVCCNSTFLSDAGTATSGLATFVGEQSSGGAESSPIGEFTPAKTNSLSLSTNVTSTNYVSDTNASTTSPFTIESTNTNKVENGNASSADNATGIGATATDFNSGNFPNNATTASGNIISYFSSFFDNITSSMSTYSPWSFSSDTTSTVNNGINTTPSAIATTSFTTPTPESTSTADAVTSTISTSISSSIFSSPYLSSSVSTGVTSSIAATSGSTDSIFPSITTSSASTAAIASSSISITTSTSSSSSSSSSPFSTSSSSSSSSPPSSTSASSSPSSASPSSSLSFSSSLLSTFSSAMAVSLKSPATTVTTAGSTVRADEETRPAPLSGGLVAAAIIGSLLAAIVVVVLIYFLVAKMKKSRNYFSLDGQSYNNRSFSRLD